MRREKYAPDTPSKTGAKIGTFGRYKPATGQYFGESSDWMSRVCAQESGSKIGTFGAWIFGLDKPFSGEIIG